MKTVKGNMMKAACAIVLALCAAFVLPGCSEGEADDSAALAVQLTVDGEVHQVYNKSDFSRAVAIRIETENTQYNNDSTCTSGSYVTLCSDAAGSNMLENFGPTTGYANSADYPTVLAGKVVMWLFSDSTERVARFYGSTWCGWSSGTYYHNGKKNGTGSSKYSGTWDSAENAPPGYWTTYISAGSGMFLVAAADGNAAGHLTVTTTLYFDDALDGYEQFVADINTYAPSLDADEKWPL